MRQTTRSRDHPAAVANPTADGLRSQLAGGATIESRVVRSIFRTADLRPREAKGQIRVEDPAEWTLALALLEFGPVVSQVGDRFEPHRLCGYLVDIAQAFSGFYENCPVLKAEQHTRESHLALCALTLQVLVQGLDMLGLEAPELM
jgi:arginyl-tRNA synthetase